MEGSQLGELLLDDLLVLEDCAHVARSASMSWLMIPDALGSHPIMHQTWK